MCGNKIAKMRKCSTKFSRIVECGAEQKVCKSCRSREELSNEYLLAKFGVDRAENGPLKVCYFLKNNSDPKFTN